MSVSNTEWQCPECTYINRETQKEECDMCFTSRNAASASVVARNVLNSEAFSPIYRPLPNPHLRNPQPANSQPANPQVVNPSRYGDFSSSMPQAGAANARRPCLAQDPRYTVFCNYLSRPQSNSDERGCDCETCRPPK